MPHLSFRLTSDADTSERMLNLMRGIEGVDHAEEVDDLMSDMHHDDSSSAGLPDDTGPGSHVLVIEADTERAATMARRAAEALAQREGLALEFVEPDSIVP